MSFASTPSSTACASVNLRCRPRVRAICVRISRASPESGGHFTSSARNRCSEIAGLPKSHCASSAAANAAADCAEAGGVMASVTRQSRVPSVRIISCRCALPPAATAGARERRRDGGLTLRPFGVVAARARPTALPLRQDGGSVRHADRGRLVASASLHALPAGIIAMQSTGQGATHSSQPVHSAGSTVCIRFAAPTIASTGQASMHSVQPMHAASSIRATVRAPGSPHERSSAMAGASGDRRQRRDQRAGAGRATIDRRAAGDRLRIRPAPRVAAAAALRLREDRVDSVGEGRRQRRAHAGHFTEPRTPAHPVVANRRREFAERVACRSIC